MRITFILTCYNLGEKYDAFRYIWSIQTVSQLDLIDTSKTLDRLSHLSQTNYPPYNIVKEDDEHFCVELAVGFTKKDIEITKEKNILTIEGKVEEDSKDFVHKGLASRAFKRSFNLADLVEIDGAEMKDGILHVRLVKLIPEEDKPISIKIS